VAEPDPFTEQQARVEELLANPPPRLDDPELQKNLRILYFLLGHARTRGIQMADGLPPESRLTIETLLAHRFELEQLLLRDGDEEYLRLRAAALVDEGAGTAVTWRDLYGDRLPPLLEEDAAPGDEDRRLATQRMLQRLLAAKEAQDLPVRARRALKIQVLYRILPLILVATLAFAVALAIAQDDWEGVLVAAAAGLCGASLGGLLKLRDEVSRGAEMREFGPFYLGQLLVGAAAGLLGYAADESGIVDVAGGSAGVAALAFALGFSEAAFLGLLARIGEPPKGA
jgi:hypothetical protein